MGARGEAGIIRKIPVTSDYGYVIQEKSFMEYDLIECSRQTISVLEFHLIDAYPYMAVTFHFGWSSDS
jgi:hypothetical protein